LILIELGTAFVVDSAVLPDRCLVESVIDRLSAIGWEQIAIGSSAGTSSLWAENRDFVVLADLFGYSYVTSKGTSYEIVNLAENLGAEIDSPESPLCGSRLSRHWTDANLRVIVGKASIDQREAVIGVTDVLVCALPGRDKDILYQFNMNLAEAVSSILELTPVHFSVLDMVKIAHGSGGRAFPRACSSSVLIASFDPLVADLVGALKMGMNPTASPLVEALVERDGLPLFDLVYGDTAPVRSIEPADQVLVAATRARDASPFLRRMLAPWLQEIDKTLFPLRNSIDDKVNEFVVSRLNSIAHDHAKPVGLIVANQILALAAIGLRGTAVNFNKSKIQRRIAGVSPETVSLGLDSYLCMKRDLEGFLSILGQQARAPRGPFELRWCKVGGSVVFSCTREFHIPFDLFINKVDISRGIQFMNDYIGGSIHVVERDAEGRPRRQVERNIYLPQPNYLAFLGGKEIDVSKIELLEYSQRVQKLYWKTIKSENGSAIYDDGILTVEQSNRNSTVVTVFGRQLFQRPPIVEASYLDRFPEFEASLIEHAYMIFFSRTFANFEAIVEGRNVAIGLNSLPDGTLRAPLPIDELTNVALRVVERSGPFLEEFVSYFRESFPVSNHSADEMGFRHFRGAVDGGGPTDTNRQPRGRLSKYFQEWTEAIGRDIASTGSPELAKRRDSA
jgi:uncharacterized protein (DUF362 family)